jgi:hypothetical protein
MKRAAQQQTQDRIQGRQAQERGYIKPAGIVYLEISADHIHPCRKSAQILHHRDK